MAPNVISMAMAKDSPYLELFRYHTIKILEDGRYALCIECTVLYSTFTQVPKIRTI